MGQDNRLERLARALTVGDGSSDEARLLTMYEALCHLPDYLRTAYPDMPVLHEVWADGTPEAIMRALVAGETHTFTTYNACGDRTVRRIGPFHRDEQGAFTGTGRRHTRANGWTCSRHGRTGCHAGNRTCSAQTAGCIAAGVVKRWAGQVD